MKGFEIRLAQNKDEIQAAFSLRNMVFVKEKQLFNNDDFDAYDNDSIYLNAWKKNILIGTVRCYPDPQHENVWWGGRLAVHPNYRRGVGVHLIRTAVEFVENHHGKQFFANVLLPNVGLFEKLGWITIGEPFEAYGQLHQLMEADLNVQNALSL